MTKQIPNIFTLLNLIFGCLAIVVIMQNGIIIRYDADGAQIVAIPERIWLSTVFIFLAAIVDFFDGFVARLLKASSEMGKQLDSLADVVSFGVAPSLIIYQFLRLSFAADENGLNISTAWLWPAFILAAAAAYRLARFNLSTGVQYGFKGMPVPVVGLFVACLPMIYWENSNALLNTVLLNKWFLYGLVLFLSWLMVSSLPMIAFKFSRKNHRANLPKYIILLIAIIAILLTGWLAAPIIFFTYIIISLAFKNNTI